MDTVKMDPPMPEENKCPQCGTPLSPGALAGLCPACLLKLGAGVDTVTDAKQNAFVPPTIAELAVKFPQLEILELIGKGGMGAVYRARQKQLDRLVALKILPLGIGDEPAFAERFTREAKALAKLNHPNIVTLYEFGDADGQFYFLMELVDGVNLRQLLHSSRIAPREALAIVPQICDALQFAHDQGIVHRDIKPENILLDRRGRVKVADFGLAKIIGGKNETAGGEKTSVTASLTDAGKVMGTPQYMSPEQIAAPGEVDHRADIYALGVVFYQMLTGELPGKNIVPPSTKVQIDVRLDEIVLRALEKNPGLRYQQVSDVKTGVETIAATPPAFETRPGTPLFPTSSGMAFKSPFALNVARAGIVLGCLAALGFVPGMRWMFGFAGFFGLIGVAVLIEGVYRFKHGIPIGSQPQSASSKISGLAIAGACWTGFFVTFYAVAIFYLKYFLHAPPTTGENLAINLGSFFGLLGLTAPFGTTILGWVAVAQIRRSAGKICGMGLAMFDGLVFPLLALNFLIWYLCLLSTIVFRNASDPSGRIQSAAGAMIVSVVVSALVDWLIIRGVWRAVNQPVAAPAPPVQKPDRFWRWFAVVVLAMISIPILIAIVGLLAAIAIPNFVKARAQAQENARHAAQTGATQNFAPGSTTNFYIRQANFPRGDAIEITSVQQTESQMTVSGHYNLVSHEQATLALYITTTNQNVPEDSQQRLQISKGRGDFQLTDSHIVPGLPHVNMYPAAGGKPFAELYFGNDVLDGGQKAVMAAVQNWLTLMDTGAFPQSWETAAESFHEAMTKDAWVKLSEQVRQPLGQLFSRKEISTQSSAIVPGMPDGSYFIAQFETSFAALTNAVETVEFMQEKDGQWKAISYLIRPRTAEQTAAVTAAQQWLAGIDAGDYAQSWTDAAEYFQGAITQDNWISAMKSVRAPLGKMEIRTVDSAVTETQMPGAPDGKYVVMQFETAFAKKNPATETVTFVLEKDGQWKADGYYIK